ncbi:MAG: hypothetical protein NC209_00805 [Alistipes sp.]|nr:hypothetical protein [Alistipes senegalensis]MCM1249673.1 hypothetical protein [Alistipes sp.]
MLGFTPFKKHANKFNYIPRYYDPEKEAREERRAELRGERAEDAGREYRPGQYIRTQREARAARRTREEATGRVRIWKMAAGAVLVLLFIYLLYPRLADMFLRARTAPAAAEAAATEPAAPRDAFDQSHVSETEWQEQRIVIVPNDYEE